MGSDLSKAAHMATGTLTSGPLHCSRGPQPFLYSDTYENYNSLQHTAVGREQPKGSSHPGHACVCKNFELIT